MTTLHTFGCSITQGFALPDIVLSLSDQQIKDLGRDPDWTDFHVYKPSQHAWPQMLADRLSVTVENHARRGACFQQIARQCAVAAASIKATDIVIVMWTYLSRLSLQWPARTSVPFCNIVDPTENWRTKILPGFNKFFGLSRSDNSISTVDERIHNYIHDSVVFTYLDPLGTYNQYYNSLVLQQMTDGFLRATGARVIHLSVESESVLDQLEQARHDLDPSLQAPYVIPDPATWYTVPVDYHSCRIILDPSIPPAENDMHPSVTHHRNFADHIHSLYFATT